MPEPLLNLFKYLFLALLYLFFLRVLRAVWIELREPKIAVGDSRPPTRSRRSDAEIDGRVPGSPEGASTAATATTGVAYSQPGGFETSASTSIVATGSAPRLLALDAAGVAVAAFPLNGETTLGRAPGCGVALTEDTFVSQIHSRLFQRDHVVWVEDLGSTNGTFVNDRRIEAATPLRLGDRLRVGQSVLELDG